MKKFTSYYISYSISLLFLWAFSTLQANQLRPGDIALLTVSSDNGDAFNFVVLKDLDYTTVVKFTDKGWDTTNTSFSAGSEGIITWSYIGYIPAGTVVGVYNGADSSSIGQLSKSGSFNISSSGDQILVYQGSESDPHFIYAFNHRSGGFHAHEVGSSTTNTHLPRGLVEGRTAISGSVHRDNWQYNCSTFSGTQKQLIQAISDNQNYNTQDSAEYITVNCQFEVIEFNPPLNLRTRFIQDTTAVLKWDTIAGATAYKVVIKAVDSLNWTNTYFKHNNRGFLKLKNLNPNTKYVWSVMAKKPALGWTLLAPAARFKTLANPCLNPTQMYVDARLHDRVRLNWTNNGSGILKYRIAYRIKGTDDWKIISIMGNSNKRSVSNLQANTEYEWKIKSVCEYGRSRGNRWSPLKIFKTRIAPANRIIGESNSYANLLEEYAAWMVYPNPNNGHFILNVENRIVDNEILSIYDISGKSVYTTTAQNTYTQVDLSELGTGVYFINFQNKFEKLVITK